MSKSKSEPKPKTLTPTIAAAAASSSSPSPVPAAASGSCEGAKRRLHSLIIGGDRGLKTQNNRSKRCQTLSPHSPPLPPPPPPTPPSPPPGGCSGPRRRSSSSSSTKPPPSELRPATSSKSLTSPPIPSTMSSPSGAFFVRSTIELAPPQRVYFRFTSAVLQGKGWELPLPPFGQGWFESVYLDDEIRVAKDIRGDYLVVDGVPYAWTE